MCTILAGEPMWPLYRGLLFEDDPLGKPLLDVLTRYLTRRNSQEQSHNVIICCPQFRAVQFQKNFCYCRRHAFVTI